MSRHAPLRWHSTPSSASPIGRSAVPTYEYRCKDCGAELEAVQAFTDDALTTCEVCGGNLRKLFWNVGISFKGSGFYKNDSRGSKSGGSSGEGGDTKTAEPAANGSSEKASSEKGSSDKGSSDKGSSDKGSSDKKPSKPSSDKGAAKPTPAASSSS
jgi:putative FmdB family regulatory protein